jgi:hypothetical protein
MANTPRFNGDQPKPDSRGEELADMAEKLRLAYVEASMQRERADAAEKTNERDFKAERDYLWNALAQIEAMVATAPGHTAGAIAKKLLKEALDGFKPTAKTERVMP